jgi:hypothetical protein
MKASKKTDLYERIRHFQQTTLSNKPEKIDMIHEVRMMNFKIRPVYGNITVVDFNNSDFIDALWSLGKLDEFFKLEFPTISEDDKEVFFKLVDDIRANLQQRLNTAYTERQGGKDDRAFFEIEIFKDVTTYIN